MAQYYRLFQIIKPGFPLMFVWDVDAIKDKAIRDFEDGECLYKYIMPMNTDNKIVGKGIENAFAESLFTDRFVTRVKNYNKPIETSFNGSTKDTFAKHVVANGTKSDFVFFKEFVMKVQEIMPDQQL